MPFAQSNLLPMKSALFFDEEDPIEASIPTWSVYSLIQRNVLHSTLSGAENLRKSKNDVLYVKHERFIVSQSAQGEHWIQDLQTKMLARWN